MKMNKRLLSMILVVVMVLGMIPLNAIATDETDPIQVTHLDTCVDCTNEDGTCQCACHQVMVIDDDPTVPCTLCDGIFAADGETVIHNPTCLTKCSCTPVDGVHVAPCVLAPAAQEDEGGEEDPLCDKCNAVKNEDGTLTHEATCEFAQSEEPLCNMCDATKDENGEIDHADGCKGPCKCEAVIEGYHSNMECPYHVEPVVPEKTLTEKLLEIDNLSDLLIGALEDEMALMELTLEEVNSLRARAEELYAAIENPTSTDADDLDGFLAVTEMIPSYRAANECPDCFMIGGHTEDCPWALGDDFGTWQDDMTISSNVSINSATTIKNNDTGGEANWTFNGGTLTINNTVTIPNGQRLDLLVAQGKTGKIVAGASLGNKPMFKLEGNAWLKIALTEDNGGQNHGSIEISGGIIEVGSGTSLYMQDISTVSGNAKWNIASGGNVYIYGDVPVSGSLTISGTANIVRRYTDGVMFPVADGGSLKIEGATKDAIVIDGNNTETKGSVINLVYNGKNAFTSKTGNISLKNVKFVNHKSTSGSACVNLAGYSTSNLSVDGCTFDNCKSVSGAAIYFNGYARSIATIKNSVFTNCTTEEGGVIRTNGAGGVNAVVEQCVFKNNIGTNSSDSDSHGGAIYWNACGTDPNGNTAKMQIWDCQFFNNRTNAYAGAVFNESFMDIGTRYSSGFTMTESTPGSIKGTLISGNSAKYGGGIQVPTYGGGMEPHNGVGAELTLKTGVFIIGNTATYGGGLAMRVGKGTIGNTPEQIASVEFEINIDGAVIRDNTATEMGGGIYLERMLGHDLYPSTVNLKSGTISGNKAPLGGGVCVYNENNEPSMKRNEVNIGSTGGTLLIENNETTGDAGLGGAVYISYGNVNMINGTVKNNEAYNGGSVYVTAGNFTMNGGTMQDNNATSDGGAVYVNGGNFTMTNGTITSNDAIDGAAAYVNDGDFRLSGGTISSNTATGNGGAAYVNGGKLIMSNGTVTTNTAVNGGGMYVNGGDFEMSNGSIYHNTASVNGGAAYVAGGNVTIHHGNLDENKAVKGGAVYLAGSADTTLIMQSGTMNKNEASDDGGAIYATSGKLYIGLEDCKEENDTALASCTHHTAIAEGRHHPKINENKASDTGGGISIENQGVVHFYCGEASGNEALYKGVGKNVFMKGGEFHLYDGADIGVPRDPDLVIVGGTLHNECKNTDYVKLYYYDKNSATETQMVGLAEYEEVINLPDGEYFWTAPTGYTFLGWTAQGAASGNQSNEFVRNKEQYVGSGEPVQILDANTNQTDKTGINTNRLFDGTTDADDPATPEVEGKIMHLYALWAPITNQITYVDGMTGSNIANTESNPDNPATYTFNRESNKIDINPVLKAGYDLIGWYIYQNGSQNANWNDTQTDYEAGKFEPINSGADYKDHKTFLPLDNRNGVLKLEAGKTNFGNITLIAHYVPAFTTLIIDKNYPAGADYDVDVNQSFVFTVTGQPMDTDSYPSPITITVVVKDDGSATIEHLPVGTYTVTEVSGWSWRYEAAPASIEVEAIDAAVDYEVDFTNTRGKNKWLDGDSICVNWFNGSKFVAK